MGLYLINTQKKRGLVKDSSGRAFVLSSDTRIAIPSQKSWTETLPYLSIAHGNTTACGRGHSTHWDSLPHLMHPWVLPGFFHIRHEEPGSLLIREHARLQNQDFPPCPESPHVVWPRNNLWVPAWVDLWSFGFCTSSNILRAELIA
jgi:hypothetical protein